MSGHTLRSRALIGGSDEWFVSLKTYDWSVVANANLVEVDNLLKLRSGGVWWQELRLKLLTDIHHGFVEMNTIQILSQWL